MQGVVHGCLPHGSPNLHMRFLSLCRSSRSRGVDFSQPLQAAGGVLALLSGLTLKDAWPFLASQWNTQPLGATPSASMVWNRDLTQVVIPSENDASTMALWDYEKRRIIRTLHSPVSSSLSDLSLAWSPDGRRILQVTSDPSQENVICWDTRTQKAISTAKNRSISDAGMMSWSPDGRHVALFAGTAFIVLNSSDGQGLFTQPLQENEVPSAFAWSPTGDRLAFLPGNTASNAFTLLLWDIMTRSWIAHLHLANVQYDSYHGWADLAWVSGTNELVMAVNTTLLLVSTENQVVFLENFTGYIHEYALAFAPDEKTLAVTDGEKIAIWNVQERRQEQVLFRRTPPGPSLLRKMSWLNAPQIAIINESYKRIVLTR
ncbi:MAG TPA: WD40 repeat domain-containing protein [Ktedonobacteraceae bacterium]|nr:WD40 repeat domain-containing protein [Ktedonobacteraceae bacterium]